MNQPKDRTHDTSLIRFHVKDLEKFGETLTAAAAAAFPKGGSRYRKVHALLLSWQDDNLGVEHEIAELKEVFEQIYKYDTEQFKIPSRRAHNALARRLSEFLDDFEARESLLIVYYGGHGHMNDDRQCVWSSTDAQDSSTVQWFGLQTMLEQADSDVLILLDYCAAASSAADAGSGVTELIAACGFETWAPGVSEHSFTRSLIDELKYWSHGPSLSVAMLHNKVLSRIKYWKPRFGNSGNHEHRKTPIYILLANDGKQRSIELTPLNPREPSASASPNALFAGTLSQSSSISSLMSMEVTESSSNVLSEAAQRADSSPLSASEVWPDHQFNCPKVLVSIALEDDQYLLTNEWNHWLASVPAVVKFANVEGLYKSDSALMLLSLPVAIWDLLPNNPAVKFLAFVRSRDLFKTSLPPERPTHNFVRENSSILSREDTSVLRDINRATVGSLGNEDIDIPQENPKKRLKAADSTTANTSPNLLWAPQLTGNPVSSSKKTGPGAMLMADMVAMSVAGPGQSIGLRQLAEVEAKENHTPKIVVEQSRTNKIWSPTEEQRLQSMRDAGNSWGEIAKTFPDRTEGSVKKHWYKDMHYADLGENDTAALLAAIKEYQSSKWKVIGQKVGKPAKACEQYAKEHFGANI